MQTPVLVENAYLTREFGKKYTAYRDKTVLLLSFAVTHEKIIGIVVSAGIPMLLLGDLVLQNRALYPQSVSAPVCIRGKWRRKGFDFFIARY